MRGLFWALLFSLLALVSGCATHALWEKTSLDAWNEPADDPNLRLFYLKEKDELIVVYDEYSERKESTRTRAYLLNQNARRVEERRRPVFVGPNLALHLPEVATSRESSEPVRNHQPTFYAITTTNSQAFTLYSGDRQIGSYDLPVYNDGKARLVRIALTPLTLTADITIIGGYIFVWAWSEDALFWLH